MTIQHMNARQLEAFKLERRARFDRSIPAPEGVTIMHMTNDVVGVVVALDDGKGGAYVIGDTIGDYHGADVPEYFA